MPIALPHSLLKNLPLRWVLTVPFVLLTLGTTALVGYLSYRSGHEAVEHLGHQLVAQTNERVTQELKLYLQSPPLINRLNVDAVNQGQLDLQNTPALETTLFNRSQQFDQMTAILFVSPQGKFRLVERLPDLYAVEADPSRPDQLRIYPLDSNGRRKKLILGKKPLDVRDRSWYKQAVTTGKPGWSSLSQYGGFEALSLTTSQPVYDRATNRLLGVFAVHLRIDYLSQFLNQLDISRAGQVIIMNQNGDLIATSTQEKLYTLTGGAGAWRQFNPLKIDQSQNALTRSLGQHLRDRTLDQSQYLEFRYNGELHYGKVTPFRDQYGLDWRILTVIPKSHFMGAIEQNTGVTVLLCVLALGAALSLGILAANKLSTRFVELNRASQDLAAGNLNQRLPMHSIAELNGLAQTFNKMADQLQHAFERLTTNLSESEEKFSVIFHASPDPITLVTIPEGRCVEVNESFLNLLEYSREELVGQIFLDLGIWVNLEERTHIVQSLHQQGYVHNLEVQFITRTEQIKTVLISAELVELNDEIYSISMVRDISDRVRLEVERKQAEAALQESENRFQQLASASPSVIYTIVKDASGSIYFEYVSPAFETLHEVPVAVALQDASIVLEQAHPDDREAYRQAIERSLTTMETFQYEWRIFTPSGRLKWLQANSQPQRRGDQIVLHGVIQDVTDRKQAEAEIQQLNQQLTERVDELQTLFNVLPIGVAISEDPACQVARVNPSLSEMLRVPIDANASPSAPDADRPAYQVYREGQVLSNENLPMQYAAIHNVEVRDEMVDIVHPDGTVINLLSYASPLWNEQGKVRGVIGGFVDITERKQVEEALRASEELFRGAFDDAPIGIALVSIEGRFLRVNRSLCNILRFTEAELLARSLQDMTDAENAAACMSGMEQLLAGDIEIFQTEKRYLQKQGNTIQGSLSVLLVKDQEKQPLYFIAQIQDISDRYQVEQMKDEFVSIISHELRTPLTSIRGALGILKSGVFRDRPEKAEHMLQVALHNSYRLVRLVNDILSLERLKSGKVPLVMEYCQVTDLMQQAINSVQTLADQSEIDLCLTPLSASLRASPDAVVQTLINLLSNAIKFSTPGDTVWLKAEAIEKREIDDRQMPADLPIPSILFMVRDQGRGIPQGKLDLIFEQFQQVDVSDSRDKAGTGLGLAICKQIVQQHRGQIWVESCLGEGSTFYFALPFSREDSVI